MHLEEQDGDLYVASCGVKLALAFQRLLGQGSRYRAKTNVIPTATRGRILGFMAYLFVETYRSWFAAEALVVFGANNPSTLCLYEAADLTIAGSCRRCHPDMLSLS